MNFKKLKWTVDGKWNTKQTCNAQHDSSKGIPSSSSTPFKVPIYVNRWESFQNIFVVFANVEYADTSNQKKPNQHNWRKHPPNFIYPKMLHAKQTNQNDNCHNDDYICNKTQA